MTNHPPSDLDADIRDHIAQETQDNIERGLSPEEARFAALRKFGNVTLAHEETRAVWIPVWLDQLVQDARYGLRMLRRNPVFTLTAVLSLAMGIGANAAVFTVIERVLLRPLPVSNPHELVFIADQRILEEPSPRFSYPFYAELRDNSVLNGTAARFSLAMNATTNGQVGRVSGELVSGNYFSVVGAGMQIGRPLTPEDDRTPGAHAVAVISNGLWQRSFGSDPSALGREVEVNSHTFTIIGVAAKEFNGTDVGSPTDIWLPMTMQRGRSRFPERRSDELARDHRSTEVWREPRAYRRRALRVSRTS